MKIFTNMCILNARTILNFIDIAYAYINLVTFETKKKKKTQKMLCEYLELK